MIWHIVKKDVRLLWPLIVLVALAQAVSATLWVTLSPFGEPRGLASLATVFSMAAILGIVILIITAVHQDPVPGIRQDWLVRPIPRRDLMLAKIAFILLMAHAPLFIADLGEGLGIGFSLSAAAGAALSRGFSILCLFSLPAAVFATVTKNLTETLVGIIAAIVACVVFMTFAQLLKALPPPIAATGLQWMMAAAWSALAVMVTGVILPVQYLLRKTVLSRSLIVAAFVCSLFAIFLPWNIGFALQQALGPKRGAGNAISLAFAPSDGKAQSNNSSVFAYKVSVHLPLHFSGLPAGALLLMDYADVRLLKPDGQALYQNRTYLSVDGAGSYFESRLGIIGDGEHGEAHTYQAIFLPAKVYAQLKEQPLRMEVEYYFTLFRAGPVRSIAALDGDQRIASLGRCATRVDNDEDGIELSCLNTAQTPSCMTLSLEHTPTAQHNPVLQHCDPDYAPYVVAVIPDGIGRLRAEAPFLDRSGLAKYPVDGSRLAESRLNLRTYEPQDHFTRQLVIPDVRLSDWAALSEPAVNAKAGS
jgi:hypothetical protein